MRTHTHTLIYHEPDYICAGKRIDGEVKKRSKEVRMGCIWKCFDRVAIMVNGCKSKSLPAT